VGFLFFRPRALLKNRTAGRPASQPCTYVCVCVCVHRQLRRRRQLKRSVKEGKKYTLHAHHNSHSHYIIIIIIIISTRARPCKYACVCSACLFANINSFITFFFTDTLLLYTTTRLDRRACTRNR